MFILIATSFLGFYFLNGPSTASFPFIYINTINNKQMWKIIHLIPGRDSNSRCLEHESPPMTTRLEPPPYFKIGISFDTVLILLYSSMHSFVLTDWPSNVLTKIWLPQTYRDKKQFIDFQFRKVETILQKVFFVCSANFGKEYFDTKKRDFFVKYFNICYQSNLTYTKKT